MTREITDKEFKSSVLESDKPVLVDFWAPWCGPCKGLSPILNEISNEYKDKALIFKINIDDNPKIASTYSIQSIPTLMFFKHGKEVDRKVGLVSKIIINDQLNKMIN